MNRKSKVSENRIWLPLDSLTYSIIQPLLVEKYVSGSMLVCKFRVPDCNTILISGVSLSERQMRIRRFQFFKLTDVVRRATTRSSTALQCTQQQLQNAVVEAFISVEKEFEYVRGYWISKRNHPLK